MALRGALSPFARRHWSKLGIVAVAMLVGATLSLGTFGAAIDRTLSSARFGVVQRAASGKVVVVEMDAKSAAAIKRWPWSRTNYAKVVELLRRARAASITFDVDFSSPSDAVGDDDFSVALSRAAGTVVLPTFSQSASSAEARAIDALPIPPLRQHAALASVSIAPDPDGQVRSMPFGTVTAGTPRPSLSAYIAQRSGTADDSFPIDMSIDPATIPRVSFIDVLNGVVDPAKIRERNILIGATAIELGDRYATPQWGVIPGVIVQALAAETLLRGVPATGSWLVLYVLAALACAAIVSARSMKGALIAAAGSFAALVAFALVAQHVFLTVYPLAAALGMIVVAGAASVARNAFARFETQRTVDEATGLPNARALLATTVDRATALAVIQIDNYESLFGILGARPASEALGRVADRLALVASDRRVYRITERQLALTLPTDEAIEGIMASLRLVLLQPVEVAGRHIDIAVSIGVARADASPDKMLADATLAADDALKAGTFWHLSDDNLSDRELTISLMGELDEGLAAGQIEVFYQPKYDLRQDCITSVEALVRWRHPHRGLVGPDKFIPLAEKTNRIGPMTLHVLEQVVRDAAGWRETHPDVTAAVNISAKLLSEPLFNAQVENILRGSGLSGAALVFEITESAAMSDPVRALATLDRYRALGIAISMDDYGTGQSTLTYLRGLPLSELKIDRSFVQHAHKVRNDAVLVRSTIQLAHDLGLEVVAEGVEDAECLAFLKNCGCDLIQGYFISRPVPLPDFLALLDQDFSIAA